MSSIQRRDRPKKDDFMAIATQDHCHWPSLGLNLLNRSRKQHCHGARQLRSSVFYNLILQRLAMNHSVDIGCLTFDHSFVEQFPCPTCQHSGYDVTEFGAGLVTTVRFTCRACRTVVTLKNTCGENVNLRFQMAVYSIGSHYMHGQRFLANMNLPPPVSTCRSAQYKERIHAATEKVAKQSMEKSASELRESLPDECNTVTVSCDGTWQTWVCQ